jgi:protein SDA1
VEASRKLYPAIELLRDPQGLAESILKRIQKTGANAFRFEHKLLAINFLTRLVGNHELMLLSLYPFLRRYMGGHQRDVTMILAYTVQACHETVPPEEIHGILKTIAHNFITERCSGEQIAVGINACRAICARTPSSLVAEDSNTLHDDDVSGGGSGGTTSIHVDVEAFARDLAGFAKHRDRSVAVSGRAWTNFVREVHPSLLQGKDRGRTGSALHRAGEKPLRYGEQRVSTGVAGADLLVEYEAKKAAYLKTKEEKRARGDESSDDESEDEDGIMFEKMNDEVSDNEEETDGPNDANDEEEMEGDEDDDDDDNAPTLVPVKIVNGKAVPVNGEANDKKPLDLSSMTPEERAKFNEEISSTRVFTAAEFEKMRKLVDRQERLKRDPRAAARLKRRKAQGKEFEELSDDDSDSDDSDEEQRVHVKGAVSTLDIMAEAKKKRANKMERLEKIVAGRDSFEHKMRDGGSTNTEKKRQKNFLMTKFSTLNRTKQSSKETARRGTLKKTKRNRQNKHENKKRRRKL